MRDWGKHTHGSPLYAFLAELIAADPELLRIINRIDHQPRPNMLFAGVQFLLGDGRDPELARYYASLSDQPLSPADSGPAFRSFVLDHEDELVEIGNRRFAQTNECRRCVALLPMTSMADFGAFHLVDVGSSAGLNLALDKYRYRIGGAEWGPRSQVVLEAESRGVAPGLVEFEVLSRTGLDLNPVDPVDVEERRWLESLIWPEHGERRARLRSALGVVSSIDVEMVAGDALETLEQVLAGLPAQEPAVVMNSFSLMQFTSAEREHLENVARGARGSRPVHRVSMELVMSNDWADLVIDEGGGPEVVGVAHSHGEWIELYSRP